MRSLSLACPNIISGFPLGGKSVIKRLLDEPFEVTGAAMSDADIVMVAADGFGG